MSAWSKRALDVVVGSVLLVLGLPIWVAVATGIRLTSPGPVLYAGLRAGKDGKPFRMYKFRSMRVGADRSGPAITARDDPRVTWIGRRLRSTKLDELPQLLNVLRGDMSLVGPRPEALEYVRLYDERQRRVLVVRPGITGPTQLRFRDEERLLRLENVEHQYSTDILPVKLESDLEYVRERTLLGDVRLLALTAWRVVR